MIETVIDAAREGPCSQQWVSGMVGIQEVGIMNMEGHMHERDSGRKVFEQGKGPFSSNGRFG